MGSPAKTSSDSAPFSLEIQTFESHQSATVSQRASPAEASVGAPAVSEKIIRQKNESSSIPKKDKEPSTTANTLPPMLASYVDYKQRYPDALLLFQVGDFYEIFFADAITVSRTLNLTLTSRDKNAAEPIPMCGVPVGVIDGYLNRLVAAGFSVALVSQQSNIPEGGKGMVPRYLDRIVTPGVQVLGEAPPGSDARVGAVSIRNERFALAFSNVTSGVLFVREDLSRDELIADIGRAQLAELILPTLADNVKIDRRFSWVRVLTAQLGESRVKYRTALDTKTDSLSAITGMAGVGALGRRAIHLVTQYVDETTAHRSVSFERVQSYSWEESLALDAATRRTLELVTNATDGSERSTLFTAINATESPAGMRMLRAWLLAPSRSRAVIAARQERVALLVAAGAPGLTPLREQLRQLADVERIATRLALGAVTPRELGALRDSIVAGHNLFARLTTFHAQLFTPLGDHLRAVDAELQTLRRSLVDNPPIALGDGHGPAIAPGIDEALDRARMLEQNGQELLSQLETDERQRTGVNTLKIRQNNQIGYFFEVTKTHAERLPQEFERRQTTTSGERFFTAKLKQLEQELLSSSHQARIRELKLYQELVKTLTPAVPALRALGAILAEIDVYCSFARIAAERGWVRPEIADAADGHTSVLTIEAGKHPVLEQLLGASFIPNGIALNEATRALLVTGPNMGGKSTYLRQTALLVLLAQVGSFVPAAAMRWSLVDAIFARLGASDNLAEGDSTFMVEMREAALICASASSQSLVLIDEIGRGTATADGRALAQAILEWLLVQIDARVLFATHFHELTDLSSLYPTLRNVSVGSVEHDGVVHFTHEIVSGPANRSYGIEVASHAGLPSPLLARARELLQLSASTAEQEFTSNEQLGKSGQIGNPSMGSRFAANASAFSRVSAETMAADALNASGISAQQLRELKALSDKLKALSLDSMTPLAALQCLAELQDIAGQKLQ